MLDCFGCEPKTIGDAATISNFLDQLPLVLGMKKLIKPCIVCYKGGETWDKGGITGFMLIAESHISIHTFTHDGFLSADVYSCKPFDTEKTIAFFKKTFGYKKAKIKTVRRGIEIIRRKNMESMAKSLKEMNKENLNYLVKFKGQQKRNMASNSLNIPQIPRQPDSL